VPPKRPFFLLEPHGLISRKTASIINMDFVEIGWGVVEWIGLAQDRYRWRVL
jgi:hypothetical protein